MPRSDNVYELPENIPAPVDDGASDHLTGMRLPSIGLMSTAGRVVDLAGLPGRVVVYCYPRTGRVLIHHEAGMKSREPEAVRRRPVPFVTTIENCRGWAHKFSA